MSLYNLVNGVSPATFMILPMLGRHPDEYPRFRDCFLMDEEHPEYDKFIHVYTRTGGGNRDAYSDENSVMTDDSNFVADFDDSFDSTFASWVFSVPAVWKDDFDVILSKGIEFVSESYQKQVRKVYPKLKEKWDELWGASDAE